MMIRFARKSPEHTEISDGIFEVCKIDVCREITFPRPIELVDYFMFFECLGDVQDKFCYYAETLTEVQRRHLP